MEKWLTFGENKDTFLALLSAVGSLGSLIFVGLGYFLAKGYLKQHREKIKEGERIRLIYDTKLKLSEARYLIDELYSIPFPIRHQLENDSSSYPDLIDEYMTTHKLKLNGEEFRLKRLKTEILSNLNLLKINDLQLKSVDMFEEFNHLQIFHTLYENKKYISSYPTVGYDEYKNLASHMYSDNPFVLRGRQLYKEVQDELTNQYWKN